MVESKKIESIWQIRDKEKFWAWFLKKQYSGIFYLFSIGFSSKEREIRYEKSLDNLIYFLEGANKKVSSVEYGGAFAEKEAERDFPTIYCIMKNNSFEPTSFNANYVSREGGYKIEIEGDKMNITQPMPTMGLKKRAKEDKRQTLNYHLTKCPFVEKLLEIED